MTAVPNDAVVPRKVRGIVLADLECEGTYEQALQNWSGLVEDCVEDQPFYAFVWPGPQPVEPDGLTHRQWLLGAAIEYLEMEYADGMTLTADQRDRLERVLTGKPLHPLSPAWHRSPMPESDPELEQP